MLKLVGCLMVCLIMADAQPQKNYKDPAEYGMYEAVVKDIDSNAFSKALTDLDAWKQKYPDSDFKNDRDFFYMLAYAGANQPAKVLEISATLLPASSLDTAKEVRILYTATAAIQQIPDPTPQQLATGAKAAQSLSVFHKIPEGMSPDVWATTKAQLQTAAHRALLYVGLVPGAQALRNKDCQSADTTFRKALGDFPESAQAAGYLGEAELCLHKTEPERAAIAIYEFARAASLDPAKGMVDPKWQQQTVEPALERLYDSYHGQDPEGLRKLKELSVKSPLPPEGFTIDSATQIAQRKQADFEAKNPQLALWMRIKTALSSPDGEQYFESDLKDVAVPQLKGVLIAAKPVCRPTELLVAVPLREAKPPFQPELAIKLEKPLSGKPELNDEVLWEATAAEFVKSPFLLTMKTDAMKIQGLSLAPCSAVVPRKKQ